MRGRRAFIILTIYLLLLGGFALMVEQIMEQNFRNPFVGASATAGPAIGQAIFAAVLLLMTLRSYPRPSSTAGAISLEREKQTLVTTPISSFAIVIGKLLSALVYVFLLIAASIPSDGSGLRVRRCRPGGHRPRLHRAVPSRPSVSARSACSARASSSARLRRRRSRSSASWPSPSAPCSCSCSGRPWGRSMPPATGDPVPLGIRPRTRSPGSTFSPRPTCCAARSRPSAAAGAPSAGPRRRRTTG